MSDSLIEIGFQVDNSDLKAGLSDAAEQIGGAAEAMNDKFESIRKSALSAFEPLHSLKDEPAGLKSIEQSFADQTAQLEILKTLYRVSADDAITQQMRIEENRYAALRAELDAEKQGMTDVEAEHEKLQAKADDLEIKHNAKMRALRQETFKESEAEWKSFLAPVSSAFQSSLDGIIRGNETLRQAMAKIGEAIVTDFVNIAVKRATNWIASELTMTEATEAGNAARTASDQAASAASGGFSFAKAIERIGAAAAETFANVYAWASPEIGPFAVIPATAASALVLAKEALIPSAAGGFDIPSGLNPVTQLHQNEMVLPAQYADVIRGMAGNGGSGGDTHIHVDMSQAQFGAGLDPRKMKDYVVAAMRQAHREGAFA